MPGNKISAQRFGGIFANGRVTVPVGRAAKLLLSGPCPRQAAIRPFDFRGAGEPEWVFGHEPIPSNNSAAVSPWTASLVRLAEGRRPEAKNSSRTRDTGNDFETHCDNSEQLLALLKSLGWCLMGADHLTLQWPRCQAELIQDRDGCLPGTRRSTGLWPGSQASVGRFDRPNQC